MPSDSSRIIVCATDLSEASRDALDMALELSAKLGAAQLHVVYVRERAERIESVEGLVEREEAREQELQREIDEEIAHVRTARGAVVSFEVLTKVCYGKAYREILHYAAGVHADLIVVGTHGRTGLGHAVLGSVAERVARYAPCDVVVAKSPEVRLHLAEALERRRSR